MYEYRESNEIRDREKRRVTPGCQLLIHRTVSLIARSMFPSVALFYFIYLFIYKKQKSTKATYIGEKITRLKYR